MFKIYSQGDDVYRRERYLPTVPDILSGVFESTNRDSETQYEDFVD